MFAKALLALFSCALVAYAQSSTTTAPPSQSSVAGLDQCIITCSSQAAASAGCASYTDLSCVCTSQPFQQAAGACLQANCTSSDITAAQAIQSQECAAVSSASAAFTSATATGTTTSTAGSTTSSSASASASAKSSSAAMALSPPFSFGSLVATLVTSAGVLVGAALTL